MNFNSMFASAIRCPSIIEAVKEVSKPLADAVLSELYPYIYFSLILVTLSFILHVAVVGLIIKYARLIQNQSKVAAL